MIKSNCDKLLVGFVFLVLAACSFLVLLPQVAFASYPPDENIWSAGYDFLGDPGGSITLWLSTMCGNLAKQFLEIASEFFNTITGNHLFKQGIDSNNFSKVLSFVGLLIENLKPVGYTILGICAGIEALRIAKDSKGLSSQWMGLGIMEAWLVYCIKFYLLYTLVANAKFFMLAIYGLLMQVQSIISSAIDAAGFSNASLTFEETTNYINGLTMGDCPHAAILIAIVCLVLLVVCAVTAIYIQVLSVMRLFEIFILLAVSPVSLSGAVSSFTSSITKSYLRTFCAAVLQLSIILLIVAIFGPLMGGITTSLNETFSSNNTGVQIFVKSVVPIVTSLSLFLMVKQSRPIADKLCGTAA